MRTRISSFSGGGWYETGRFLIPMRSFHFSIQWSRWKSVIGNVRDPGRKEKNVRDASRWSGLFVIRCEKPMLRVGNSISSIQCHAAFWKKTGDVHVKISLFGLVFQEVADMKLVASSSQCVRFTLKTMVEMKVGDRECSWSGSKGKECSRCKSVIGTVRDPVRKANASRWEFHFKHSMPCCVLKKNRRCARKDQSLWFSFSGGGWYETGRFLIPMRSFHFSRQWSRWKSVIGNVRDPGRNEKNVRDASRWSGLFVIRCEKPMLRVGNFISSIQCHAAFWKKTGDVHIKIKGVSMKVLKIPLSSR